MSRVAHTTDARSRFTLANELDERDNQNDGTFEENHSYDEVGNMTHDDNGKVAYVYGVLRCLRPHDRD